MTTVRPSSTQAMVRAMDPRHSLVTGLIWLVVALAAAFALAASLWVGRVAREIVVQQHVRRLVLETDQLGSDMGQAVSARVTAALDARRSIQVDGIFEYLQANHPDLSWIAVADAAGTVVGSDGSMRVGTQVGGTSWFSQAARPWIGLIERSAAATPDPVFGDLSVAVRDSTGRIVAVIAARLTWRWASHDMPRLSANLDARGPALTLVLDAAGVVRVGPPDVVNRRWDGLLVKDAPPIEPNPFGKGSSAGAPHFERLRDGTTALVARAPILIAGDGAEPGWEVQLSEPKDQVYQRANALVARIGWISLCLGAATALVGALAARHLTHRLRRLTRSAVTVGHDDSARLEVPRGNDEVAQLGAVFARVLDDLRVERRGLLTLSSELERRVMVRTREVELLAEESRYAAIVRERLKIARDLHDTLAHSMMAMLSEIRLLRKLHAHDPPALAEELARAEQVAHDGLNEARTAITQMRVNEVRDTGLGPALAKAFNRFIDHTGLTGEFNSVPEASRMAEEALRNIERHAMATRVVVTLLSLDDTHVSLRIVDDGVGFDPELHRPGHFGLVGLREQAQLIGADLSIDSLPNRGTQLSVTLRIVPELL